MPFVPQPLHKQHMRPKPLAEMLGLLKSKTAGRKKKNGNEANEINSINILYRNYCHTSINSAA